MIEQEIEREMISSTTGPKSSFSQGCGIRSGEEVIKRFEASTWSMVMVISMIEAHNSL